VQDSAGRWRFDPTTLDSEAAQRSEPSARTTASRPSTDGKRAAQATRLYSSGKTVRDVVVELEVTYAEAQSLRQEFARAGDDLLLSADAVDRLRGWLGWTESPPSEKGLLDAVMEKIRRMSAEHTRQVDEWKAKLASAQQEPAAAPPQSPEP
jgi:hypothetical protein